MKKGNGSDNPFYRSAEWQAIRKRVLMRDGRCCTRCGGRDRLTVHHIQYLQDAPHLALTMSNLTTVCGPCHSSIHAHDPSRSPHAKATALTLSLADAAASFDISGI